MVTSSTDVTDTPQRNPYVDWLRAFSLIVVVLWHWAFTILSWNPETGPHATSPLGFMKGFWLATWLFQVMPLFFYIGGYVHLRSWEKAREPTSLRNPKDRAKVTTAMTTEVAAAEWMSLRVNASR